MADTASATPYHMKEEVGTAKYHAPAFTPRKTGLSNPNHELRAGMFKTEKWRERGCARWPAKANEEMMRRPTQFRKAQEVTPLQRMEHQEMQPNLHSELWTRSLREQALSIHEHIGAQNQNAFTSAVKCMFNEYGQGYTGKTNVGRKIRNIDHKDWVEKPVAVGMYATDHLQGSRYAFNLSSRPCVPNSMGHTCPSGSLSAR